MNVITLKLPDNLHAALKQASAERGLSKSALVREALESALQVKAHQAAAAERWVAQWRGRLTLPAAAMAADAGADSRLVHLLNKHLR